MGTILFVHAFNLWPCNANKVHLACCFIRSFAFCLSADQYGQIGLVFIYFILLCCFQSPIPLYIQSRQLKHRAASMQTPC